MLEVVLLCYVRRNSKRTYRRQTTPATGYLDSWNRLKFKSSYFFHFQSATFSLFYSLYHTVKILELNLNLKGCCNLKKPPTDQVSLGTGNRDIEQKFYVKTKSMYFHSGNFWFWMTKIVICWSSVDSTPYRASVEDATASKTSMSTWSCQTFSHVQV